MSQRQEHTAIAALSIAFGLVIVIGITFIVNVITDHKLMLTKLDQIIQCHRCT